MTRSSTRRDRRAIALAMASTALAVAPFQSAWAGDFNASGRYVPAAEAVDFESFAMPERFVPADAEKIGRAHV